MIIILSTVFTLLALVFCVPVTMFCFEVLLALLPRRNTAVPALPANCRVAVLVPAHNEQAVIGATLRALVPTVPRGGRVVVIADNCTDSTAEISRMCGTEAVERRDHERRGKGFALDFGIAHLQWQPPEVVVFLDADCRVAPDTVRLLAAAAVHTQRPVQGLNLCDPDPQGGPAQLIWGLAFRFKNLVRTLGLVRLAGLNNLTGTGMALPWSLIEQAKLAHGNVVEDMQLGIDLALAGRPPMFLPEARVDSPLPQQRAAAVTQRTRWEHGHLNTLIKQSPRLLRAAIEHRRLDLAWLALDLAIPPLSLLVLALSALTAMTAIAWLVGASALPVMILIAEWELLAGAVFIGWAAYCRQQVPPAALVAVLLNAARKLLSYFACIFRRLQDWIETQRGSHAAGAANTKA